MFSMLFVFPDSFLFAAIFAVPNVSLLLFVICFGGTTTDRCVGAIIVLLRFGYWRIFLTRVRPLRAVHYCVLLPSR